MAQSVAVIQAQINLLNARIAATAAQQAVQAAQAALQEALGQSAPPSISTIQANQLAALQASLATAQAATATPIPSNTVAPAKS
jgi:hypothetical protein